MQNLNYGVVEDDSVKQENARENTREKKNDVQTRIIEVIKANPQLTIPQIAEKLSITNSSAIYHLRTLKKMV